MQQKLVEKAYFIFKLTGRTKVRPASSDKWKAPLEYHLPPPPAPLYPGLFIQFAPCKGIRIPESAEILLAESGILGFGIRNTAQGSGIPLRISLRSCPLPIIPLGLSREEVK